VTEADIFTVEPGRSKNTKPSVFQKGLLMSGKLSITVIIFGCALILLGLSFLPAAFSRDNDETILGAAICAVAFVVAWFFGSLFPWLRAIGGLVVAFIVWGLWVYWTAEKESRAFDKKRRRK